MRQRLLILLLLVTATAGASETEHTSIGAEDATSKNGVATPEARGRARPATLREGFLGEAVAEVEAVWKLSGKVSLLPARSLARGHTQEVDLPTSATQTESDGCTTVAALSPGNISFGLLFQSQQDQTRSRAWPVPSSAGVAEVTRCGERRALLRSLLLRMRSPRGTVQVLVYEGDTAPPPVTAVLPARDAGASMPTPEVGPRPALGPRVARVARRKGHYLRSGAEAVTTSGILTDERGRALDVIHLGAGCHRLDLLAEGGLPVDLDAELFTLQSGELVLRDDHAASDARITRCLGRPQRFRLGLRGAPPGTEVTLVHARWPLPSTIPVEWGPIARARLSEALLGRRLPSLSSSPIVGTLGVQGTTQVTFEAAGDRCYVLAMAVIQGNAERLALGGRAGPVVRQSRESDAPSAVSVSLCPEASGPARVETQALGRGVAWILGVWEIGPPPAIVESPSPAQPEAP